MHLRILTSFHMRRIEPTYTVSTSTSTCLSANTVIIDRRSLYETVHFSKEPTVPTLVLDSTVQVDATDSGLDPGTVSADEETAVSGQSTSEYNHEDRSLNAGELSGDTAFTESTEPRMAANGASLITLSVVPKAYWASLFHLEEIKLRNRPEAPPQAPAQAPFFLPTVVQGGSTPSFPTPEEFLRLSRDISLSAVSSSAAVSTSAGMGNSGLPDDRTCIVGDASIVDGKKCKTGTVGKRKMASNDETETGNEEDFVLQELANMGSGNWGQDDTEAGNESCGDDQYEHLDKQAVGGPEDSWVNGPRKTRISKSKGKSGGFARCKLVAYLAPDYLSFQGLENAEVILTEDSSWGVRLLEYFKRWSFHIFHFFNSFMLLENLIISVS